MWRLKLVHYNIIDLSLKWPNGPIHSISCDVYGMWWVVVVPLHVFFSECFFLPARLSSSLPPSSHTPRSHDHLVRWPVLAKEGHRCYRWNGAKFTKHIIIFLSFSSSFFFLFFSPTPYPNVYKSHQKRKQYQENNIYILNNSCIHIQKKMLK